MGSPEKNPDRNPGRGFQRTAEGTGKRADCPHETAEPAAAPSASAYGTG